MTEREPSAKTGHNDGSPVQDIYKASSVAEIRATLSQLKEREATVTASLDALVESQNEFSRELGRLDLLRAHIGSQVVTARGLSHGRLGDAAATAKRISVAVKRLDLEQSRVKATLEVVEQVAELKACVLGVTGSMGAPQDWEKAAGYLNRASKIPKEILSGQFVEEMVPTAEVPDPPSVTLESAAESLCGLFLREFEKAAKAGDGAKVTRFFKLFPLIGRSDVGLDVYGRYVCQGVASRTRTNMNAGTAANQRKDGVFYAHALSKLFEHIAQIVDGHGGLVERHYGAGSMVKVIERLQLEADMQGGIIIDTWSDERNIIRRLSDIRSYAFTFLVQSFLPQQKPGGTTQSGAAASRERAVGRIGDADEGTDMKEVDGLLGEAAIMLGRWSLYCRFLATKSQSSGTEAHGKDEVAQLSMPHFLVESNLNKKINDRLISPFNTMTTFFFRRSVEKAFQLDEHPSDLTLDLNKPIMSNPPFITSAVDDVMYIVNKVLQRSLATSQRAVVSGVVPTIGRVLGSDFVGMVQRKMRDESYPKAAVQGGLPPADKIVAFLVLINNLDLATEYIKRIIQSRVDPSSSSNNVSEDDAAPAPLTDLFPFDYDGAFLVASLRAMEHSFESKTSELITEGIYVTFDRVIKPRLRSILADAFRDADYQLTDTDLAERAQHHDEHTDDRHLEDNSPVKHRFERGWDALMKPIRRILTDRNYDKLLSTTATYLSGKMLEKRIWSYYGRVNELGAVRLERDIAGIVAAVIKGGKYGLRDTFARCAQICLIMTMEEDEWEQLLHSENLDHAADDAEPDSGIDWKLSRDEQSRARAMVKEN